MRDIKFKGKRTGNGEWVFGDLIRVGKHVFIKPSNNEEPMDALCRNDSCDLCAINTKAYRVDPATVGEYTGLKDKNGVEIYEGDICTMSRPCVLADVVITYENAAFWGYQKEYETSYPLRNMRIDGFEIKVIGNVHDNPELAKEA